MDFNVYSYNQKTETIIYSITQEIYDVDAWIKNHEDDILCLKSVVDKLRYELSAEINIDIEFNTPVVNIITDISSDNIDILHKVSKQIKDYVNNCFMYPTVVYHSSNCIFLNFNTRGDT